MEGWKGGREGEKNGTHLSRAASASFPVSIPRSSAASPPSSFILPLIRLLPAALVTFSRHLLPPTVRALCSSSPPHAAAFHLELPPFCSSTRLSPVDTPLLLPQAKAALSLSASPSEPSRSRAVAMFSWLKRGGARGQQPEAIRTVTSALKELYRTKLLPLEEHYRFGAFHSPALEDADFDGKPMVLVAGQYSTGKTSFIQYLLEQEVPGSRVGPEPTTDCFVAVMHGETEGTVPGNALVVDPDKPFRKLNPFGNTFLNRCAG